MTSSRYRLLPVVFLIIVGCSGVQVSQDYDSDRKEFPHGTWNWKETVRPSTGDPRIDNPLLDKRIRRAVGDHLENRNILLDTESPDLLVTYQLAIESRIRIDPGFSSWGAGFYAYPWYGGIDTSGWIYQYDQCRLTIDIYAADTQQLVWRGVGTYMFENFDTPDAATRAMQNIVDRILGQFPPKDPQ